MKNSTNGTHTNGTAEFARNVRNGARTDRLFRASVRDALREHKRLGQSVVVWQDGKIVTLAPEDIPVDLSEKPE